MSEDDMDEVKAASTAMQAVGQLVGAAGDTPEAKEAGSNLGKAAVTVTSAINNCLLPIAAVNYAFDRAKNYFQEQFQQDLEAVAADIPPDDLVEPKPSLAAPALQGLAFSHDEDALKQMYLELLATAMNSNKAGDAHPAFVEIIRQMTAEEAKLVSFLLKSSKMYPVCEVRLDTPSEKGYRVLYRHLLAYVNLETDKPEINKLVPAMIENWVRLGLVKVSYDHGMAGDGYYDWADERPEVFALREQWETEEREVLLQRGYLCRTPFGEQFALAVGIEQEDTLALS